MVVKVTIVEEISQEFEIDVPNNDVKSIYDKVQSLYDSGELVVEDPSLLDAKVLIPCGLIDKELNLID